MEEKVIVVRTIRQLDYLLVKFSNKIVVYTKPDGGLSEPKVISLQNKDRRAFYNIETIDGKLVDDNMSVEVLESILDDDSVVMDGMTKTEIYPTILGYTMKNHRLLLHSSTIDTLYMPNEYEKFIREYDALEDIVDGSSYLRVHNKNIKEEEMVYVWDVSNDVQFPIRRKFNGYDNGRVVIESIMFHRELHKYDFASREKPTEVYVRQSILKYHRHNIMHKKVNCLDITRTIIITGICDNIYIDGKDIMCIIIDDCNKKHEMFLDDAVVLA